MKHEHLEHSHEYSCCHCHEHKNDNSVIIRIIVGGILFLCGVLSEKILNSNYLSTFLFVIGYCVLGYDIIFNAVKHLFKGKFFDENLLMSIASIGAFIVGEHPEAVAVMLFYQVGELLQERAEKKSRNSISELMDIRPDYANLKIDNDIKKVSPDEVKIGDVIIVKSGEKIPLDATILNGETYINSMALTGEDVPYRATVGDKVLSGSINVGPLIEMKVEKTYSESAVSKILDLVEEAQEKKAKSERFISVFARYYTPIVVLLSLTVMIIPPLFLGNFSTWIYRGLMFLVVSCPCALVVSVPLGFFAGIGCASKNGILIKGGSYIERLSKLDTVVFDKTGTLTKGIFQVNEIHSLIDENIFMKYASYSEFYSNHPIALSIKNAYKGEIDTTKISDYEEKVGMGISATIDGHKILIGKSLLLTNSGIDIGENKTKFGTIVYLACDGKYIGYITITDEIKSDSGKAVSILNKMNIKTAMLTGDRNETAEFVGRKIGIQSIYSQLLPQDKVDILEKIIDKKRSGKFVAYVGDGINDAPVLMLSDVGIAMGAIGSDSAIESSDVVLMTDEPTKICNAIRISKRTMSIIIQNIIFAIGIKVIIMLLSVIGISTMWLAIFADVGVSVLAILNSLRAFKS